MNSDSLRKRAQRGYALGRIKASWFEVLAASVIVVITLFLSSMHGTVLLPGFALIFLTAVFSYYGREPGRFVLPALILGLIPLTCALASQFVGHVCVAGGCTSLCVPLCTAGGLVSGVLLARSARASRSPGLVWLSGGALVLCAGAMGCVCVGASGVVGMSLGLLSTSAILALGKPDGFLK